MESLNAEIENLKLLIDMEFLKAANHPLYAMITIIEDRLQMFEIHGDLHQEAEELRAKLVESLQTAVLYYSHQTERGQ